MSSVLYSDIDVKSWIANTPSVEEARPRRCVCGVPTRALGEPLKLWGHGIRWRQLCGPLSEEELAEFVLVLVRRYLCRECGAVLTVLPRGVTARHLYPLWVIVLGLTIWTSGQTAAEVRRALSPFRSSSQGWPSLQRWARADWLVPKSSGSTLAGPPLSRARTLVQLYAGFAPPSSRSLSLIEMTCEGARRVMAETAQRQGAAFPTT